MIKIREAKDKDVEELFNLMLKIAKFHNQEQFFVTNKDELLSSGFNENPKFGALLAEFNGKLVGYLSYTWNYSIWNGCDFMGLDDLFILKEFRSQNIGYELMQYARNICNKKNVELIRWEVEKDNFRAIDFYKRVGAKINIKGIFRWSLVN